MEYVDKIKKGEPDDNGLVTNPDKIIKHAGRRRRREVGSLSITPAKQKEAP